MLFDSSLLFSSTIKSLTLTNVIYSAWPQPEKNLSTFLWGPPTWLLLLVSTWAFYFSLTLSNNCDICPLMTTFYHWLTNYINLSLSLVCQNTTNMCIPLFTSFSDTCHEYILHFWVHSSIWEVVGFQFLWGEVFIFDGEYFSYILMILPRHPINWSTMCVLVDDKYNLKLVSN